MNIVFAGTPEFSVPPLQALIEAGHHVVAVYTQPDRPAGRGRKLMPSPVKQLALDHHIPVLQPDSLKTAEAEQALRQFEPDIMVVVAYGLILPQAVLDIPAKGCLNIHASLLPRWRGAAPIQRAIEAGDSETGITIMQMDAGLDTGDMLLVKKCPIEHTDTAQILHDRLSQLGAKAIVEALASLDTLQAEKQDDSQANYAVKLNKAEADIDWTRPADLIAQKIRALNPWPVASTHWQGRRLRAWNAQAHDNVNTDLPPGTIIETGADGIVVQAGQGTVRLTELQSEGGKAMPARDFINGNAVKNGQVLGE